MQPVAGSYFSAIGIESMNPGDVDVVADIVVVIIGVVVCNFLSEACYGESSCGTSTFSGLLQGNSFVSMAILHILKIYF
jgi:hypothetical protein